MIYTKLMEHQKKVLGFSSKLKYCGIFADYGTGKSLCALSYIDLKKLQKVLIVSTKTSILSTWVDEIKLHTDFRYIILMGADKNTISRKEKIHRLMLGLSRCGRRDVTSSSQTILFLLNYDGVHNIYNELIQANFDAIICDESTKIKSIRTQRTKALIALGGYIDRRMILTGFPATEGLQDIYSQIKFLDKGSTLGTYQGFLDRNFVRVGNGYIKKRHAVKNIMGLIKPFCIRVSKSVLKLPPTVYKVVKIQETKQQKEIMKQLNSEFRVAFGKVNYDTEFVFGIIAKSLQVSDGFISDKEGRVELVDTNKDEAFIDVLDEINPNRNKVVVWCHFKQTVKKLSKILDKLGVNYQALCGDTKNVNQVVSSFQHGKTEVLLATLKKASESITLTSSQYAIYYGNWWSHDLRGNSEARICRKGSEKHSFIVYTDLCTTGTIDTRVLRCLRNKKNIIAELKKEFV